MAKKIYLQFNKIVECCAACHCLRQGSCHKQDRGLIRSQVKEQGAVCGLGTMDAQWSCLYKSHDGGHVCYGEAVKSPEDLKIKFPTAGQ